MRNTRRVVITGLGAVTPLGLDVAQFCESLRAGRCGIGPLETVDSTSLRFKNGAEVRDFTPSNHFTEKALDQLDRFAQLGLVAAREAQLAGNFVAARKRLTRLVEAAVRIADAGARRCFGLLVNDAVDRLHRAGGEEEVRGLGRGGRLGGGGGLGGDERSHALSMSEHLFRCQGNCSLWRKLVVSAAAPIPAPSTAGRSSRQDHSGPSAGTFGRGKEPQGKGPAPQLPTFYGHMLV